MMNTVFTRWNSNEKGAALVEFAIVLPLLLVTIFGVIEWGLYMFNRQVITNAAREGARHGIIMRPAPRHESADDDAIKNEVVSYAQAHLVTFGADELTADDIEITRKPKVPGGNPLEFESDLEVRVPYTYEFLFLSTLGIDSLTITGISTMKME